MASRTRRAQVSFPRAIGSLLRWSLADAPTPPGHRTDARPAGPISVDGIAAAARFHGISGYVHRATRDLPGVPEPERNALAAQRRHTVLTHMRTIADLRLVGATLDVGHIPWLVVKGPTLAEPVHGAIELRSYSDLDLLVPPGRLGDAIQALEAVGGEVVDRNWKLIREELKGEVHLRLPSGTDVDLHWHLLNERQRREAFPVQTGDLMDRRRMVSTSGLEIPTLATSDTIVYVAVHAMHSGGHRLVWLKDLERLLADPGADVDAICGAARGWRAELVLRSAVIRTECAIGTPPLANALLDTLPKARIWSAVNRSAWRLAPAEREDGTGSIGRIVARAVGPNQRTSVAQLLSRALQRIRIGEDGRRDGPRRFSPDDPRSGRYEAGGASGRIAYLEAVRQQEVREKSV